MGTVSEAAKCDAGTAKVADVGLAKILTREHTMVSSETTFDWAAPEVSSQSPLKCTMGTNYR